MHNSLKIPLKQLLGIRTIGLPFIKPLLLERKYCLWVWGNDNSVTNRISKSTWVLPGWRELGRGDEHPCHGNTVSQPLTHSDLCTPCTCYECLTVSHTSARYQSSWSWWATSLESENNNPYYWEVTILSLQDWEVVVIAIIRNIIIYTTTYLTTHLL